MNTRALTYVRGMARCHVMENRIPIGLKLPPSLIAEVDRARFELEFPADRTAVIERALREWLERHRETKKRAVKETS